MNLIAGHETLIRTARGLLPVADAAVAEVSTDLLIQRLQGHEKTAWMLRSRLQWGSRHSRRPGA